jgi:membrane protein implicated in regulation of membrane protease activity
MGDAPKSGLSYKARRRWSLFLLVIGLPAYIIVASVVMTVFFDRPPFWVELLIYIVLGVAWALPFKMVFRGVGKPDPDQDP